MHQELEALRAEVERLQQKKENTSEPELPGEGGPEAETETVSDAVNGEEESLLADMPGLDKELLQQLKGLVKQFEQEYENLSPTVAVLIFALGAMFGRSLSSK